MPQVTKGRFLEAMHLVLRNDSSHSCVMGLFTNNVQVIHEQCSIEFIQGNLKQEVVQLDRNYVMVKSVAQLHLHCQGRSQTKEGCDYCVMWIPTGCTIVSPNQVILPSLEALEETQVKVRHHINLAVLREFFSEKELQNLVIPLVSKRNC